MLYDDFGELLFTHFGISGPLVLTASSRIGKKLEKGTSGFSGFEGGLVRGAVGRKAFAGV